MAWVWADQPRLTWINVSAEWEQGTRGAVQLVRRLLLVPTLRLSSRGRGSSPEPGIVLGLSWLCLKRCWYWPWRLEAMVLSEDNSCFNSSLAMGKRKKWGYKTLFSLEDRFGAAHALLESGTLVSPGSWEICRWADLAELLPRQKVRMGNWRQDWWPCAAPQCVIPASAHRFLCDVPQPANFLLSWENRIMSKNSLPVYLVASPYFPWSGWGRNQVSTGWGVKTIKIIKHRMFFFSSCFPEKRVGAKYRGNWVYEGYLFLFILGWKSLGHLTYSEQRPRWGEGHW